jgi:hypothetical protein
MREKKRKKINSSKRKFDSKFSPTKLHCQNCAILHGKFGNVTQMEFLAEERRKK